MKYILETEMNENGNLVFRKEKDGDSFWYFAKDEDGYVTPVKKDVLLKNRKSVINLGVAKDGRIYPITPKNGLVKKKAVVKPGVRWAYVQDGKDCLKVFDDDLAALKYQGDLVKTKRKHLLYCEICKVEIVGKKKTVITQTGKTYVVE